LTEHWYSRDYFHNYSSIDDVFNLLLGIFKLLNKSQPLDVPALQQIIIKLDSNLDEVSTSYF